MSQKIKLHSHSLVVVLMTPFVFACNTGKIDFQPNSQTGEKLAVEAPPSDLPPLNPEPTNPEPTNPEPTNPGPTNPEPTNPTPTNPPITNPPGGQNPPTNPPPSTGYNRCGGPGNPDLYTGYSEIVKSQSRELFDSYGACQAARTAFFGNSMVCSKAIASTILGCMQTPDYRSAVLEINLALPNLKSTGKMEVPYDYYLLDIPNCGAAAAYINSHMGANMATAGQFTGMRADIQAACANSNKDLVIHVLRIR